MNQMTDHQGLVDRINAAAAKAQLELDQADLSAASGGTVDLTGLRAAVTDMISASHGFEALAKAGAATPRQDSASDKASSSAAPPKQQSASPGSSSSPGKS